MEAIAKVPEMLEHATDELKGDAEFIVEALKLGCSLGHASPSLRRDKDVVLTAVEHSIEGLMFASENLQRDRCACQFPAYLIYLPLCRPVAFDQRQSAALDVVSACCVLVWLTVAGRALVQ